MGGGEVLGGLFFGHPQPGVFTERAERLVVGIAGQAAIAMENARLYGEVQRAVRTRDDFLAAVSHDVKNPLASIKGFAQILQRHLARSVTPDVERMTTALTQIDGTTTRMVSMIDSLIDVTRLEMGRGLQLECAPTDLVGMVRRLAEEHAQFTSRHAIVVETNEQELIGHWESARLERVVDNLLGNAVKYSPDGGAITIRLALEDETTGRWAVLTVQDRGLGIPSADVARVFERFYRGGNVTDQVGGADIGLANVRQTVEQHGGSVTVASTEGKGSTFTVRLPLSAGPRASR